MKKILRNLLLSLVVLIPFNAMALTYALGTPEDGTEYGTKTIPIYLNNISNELSTDKLSCETTDKDKVDCKIEAVTNYTINDGRITTQQQQVFTNGVSVGHILLTNKTTKEVTTKVLFMVNGETKNTMDDVKISAKPSSDASLKSLSFGKFDYKIDPAWDPEVTSYTVYNIAASQPKLEFTWECDNCSIKFEGGTEVKQSIVRIDRGESEVKAIVTSEDQTTTRTYVFKVIKGETTYNSNKLKSLSISDYEISPKFDKDTLEYEIKIPKKISNIENILKYEAEDSGAKVTVDGANKLDNDENTVTITVTSRDGSKTEYKIKVVKENVDEIIEVIGYKDNKVTYMNVEGVREELTEEEFKKKYPNDWAKIEDGTYKFDENGNIIRESNTTNDESTKKEEKKNSFPWLIVVLIVLAIIIIAVAGFFIFREPDKDKKDKDNKGKKDSKEEVEEIVPTEEEQEHLDDIDSYNEEARLIAENNIEEAKKEKAEKEEIEEAPVEEEKTEEPKEKVVKEETIDDYKDEEKSPTMDIDEALSDLMNTKEYNFKD